MSPKLSDDPPTNKRIACIECRQQKVRCDAHDRWPNACTRCSKKKSECVLQPDFKRTSKRKRLVEMEQEMEMLRKSIETQEHEKRKIVSGSLLDLSNSAMHYPVPISSKPELPAPTFIRHKSFGGSSVESASPSVLSVPPLQPLLLDQLDSMECSAKSMDEVTLSPETIKDLFKEYVEKYHPYLPVVDVSRGPEKIHELCPPLFWTIMSVASRRYQKDSELMMRLSKLLINCLSEITISPVTRFAPGESGQQSSQKPYLNHLNLASVYSVQAFLICTMWAPLTSSISADSSWNTAGVAIFSAIKVGLHCPGYARDFGRIKVDNPIYPQISEQIRTWICCNIVSQTIATVYGFPAFNSFDASVISACRHDSGLDIPVQIKQMMEIQHIENETEKSMNANVINPLALSELSERFSLVHIMARKLDDLDSRIGVMDDTRKFTFLAAKVHLMAYYFLDNSGFTNLQLQKGLVQAYNSALALIDHCDQADSRNKQFMRYLPGVYMQTLWQSTSIIAKVFHSPFAEYVDAGSGKDLYFRCIQLLSKASILKHDMAYRAAEITHQVWQVFASLTRKNILKPQISIRTRMAASIFFDTLWTMREECGIMSVAPAVLNQRNSENDDSGTQTPSNDNTTGNTSSSGNDKRYEYLPYDPAMRSATPMKFEEDTVSSIAPTPAPLSSIVNTMSTPLSIAEHQQQQRQQQQQQQTTQKEISSDQLINQSSPPLPIFDWDADLVWRDVDMMMNDFGFRVEEVAPL